MNIPACVDIWFNNCLLYCVQNTCKNNVFWKLLFICIDYVFRTVNSVSFWYSFNSLKKYSTFTPQIKDPHPGYILYKAQLPRPHIKCSWTANILASMPKSIVKCLVARCTHVSLGGWMIDHPVQAAVRLLAW